MIAAFAFVIIPLALYIPLLCVEWWYGVSRLRSKRHLKEYFDISWETTHTLLIFSVNNFLWMWSEAIPFLASSVLNAVLVVAFAFCVRAVAYLGMYDDEKGEKSMRLRFFEYLFVCSHVGIVGGLLYIVIRAWQILSVNTYSVHTQFLPYMIPGAVLVGLACALPLRRIYIKILPS